MSERDDEITALLKRHYDPVLTEPIPARMHLRQPRWLGYAKAASIFAGGVALGLALPLLRPAPPMPVAASAMALPVRAARAHAVYAAEVRHPVEVDASQQEHLVKWLSKRLGHDLRVPVLTDEGFELLGGRLLPGPDGAVAQFMYQEASGKRLTLYVARRGRSEPVTAFRFAKDGPVSVFYWVDQDCGYALSGEVERGLLSRLATSVHRQLEM